MTKVTIYRTRKSKRKLKQIKDSGCPFCNLDERIIEETPTMAVIENAVPYDWWDFRQVTQHFMVIPKRHVETIAELNQTERKEYLEIIAKYESEGYSLYLRSAKNQTRSQPHLHTHLIKSGKENNKFILVISDLGLRIIR